MLRRAVAGCVVVVGTGLVGCGGPTVVESPAATTPPIGLTEIGGYHTLVMQAPNPGWDLEIDGSDRAPGTTHVLVSVRRPDPALLYPSVIAEKHAVTGVRASEPIRVFGRVVEHKTRSSGKNYRPVPIDADEAEAMGSAGGGDG